MQGIRFDYFHGMEAGQYSFYRIPTMLFTAEYFKTISCEARVLYGLMLDRMGLSIRNGWLDKEDRVYIVFTVEEIAGFMDYCTQKAVKLMKELDADSGIRMIEKKRLGLGKPNIIYVKNFMEMETPLPDKGESAVEEEAEAKLESRVDDGYNLRVVKIKNQE